MNYATAGLLAALTALSAMPAVGLECLTQSISRDYRWYEDRPEKYVLVLGSFSSLKILSSKPEGTSLAELREETNVIQYWSGSFSGFSASPGAFDKPFKAQVTLIFPDYSHIGGAGEAASELDALAQKNGLVWLMVAEAGYQWTARACGGIVDTNPEHVEAVLQCLRGEHCPRD